MPNQTKARRMIDIELGEEVVLRSKGTGTNAQELIFSSGDQGLLTLKPSSFVMDGVDYKNKEIHFTPGDNQQSRSSSSK